MSKSNWTQSRTDALVEKDWGCVMGSKQLDNEIQCVEDEFNEGVISTSERNKRIGELERDYDDAARDSADEAWQNEYERW